MKQLNVKNKVIKDYCKFTIALITPAATTALSKATTIQLVQMQLQNCNKFCYQHTFIHLTNANTVTS